MTLPGIDWIARLLLTLGVIGTASALTTALLVQDQIPFGAFREWLWLKHPPRTRNPVTEEVEGTLLGYWWTCPRCAGVWSTAIWFGAYLVWPTGTLVVAFPFAAAQVQRWWNART